MTGFKSKKAAALDEEGMYPVHEAMLAYWGERCSAYHGECVCCQAWEQYDGKTSAQPAQEPVGVVQHKLTATFGADYEQVAVFCRALDAGTHLYQRPWVGLTEEEIEDLFEIAADADEETHIRFALAIQAKFKMKNI